MCTFRKWHVGILIALQLIIILSLTTCVAYTANEKDATDAGKDMTEADLQGYVMAFADRYWSIMNSAGIEYAENQPSPEKRRMIKALVTYSAADAFTIAAGPKPVAAFLDMVVMVTLGRMVFEEHYAKIHGREVAPLVDAFKKAEADIWGIAGDILTAEQQHKLMDLIQTWRQKNPKNIVFSSVRFSEFEKFRGFSDDSGKKSSGGLFRSVARATEQVEEMRLISERAMYLGSRLPMLTGAFADVWASRLTRNQDVNAIIADLNRLADVTQRIADIVEKLPDDVASERDTAINQVLGGISAERENTIHQLMQEISRARRQTIEDIVAQEKRIGGVLTELKRALMSANDLLISTNTILDRLNIDQREEGATETFKSFDIKEYQATLRDASTAIGTLHELVKTIDQMELENKLPAMTNAIEKMGQQGEEWIRLAFLLGVVLILILLIGSVLAVLSYRYIAQKMFSTKS